MSGVSGPIAVGMCTGVCNHTETVGLCTLHSHRNSLCTHTAVSALIVSTAKINHGMEY